MSIKSPNFSQYPNEILDEWMPKLSGADFKIISLIVRNTFGWKKEKNKISITQLMKNTGLSRSQVIESIKRLLSFDLIECKKKSGVTSEFSIKVQPVQKLYRLENEPVQKLDQVNDIPVQKVYPTRPESSTGTRPESVPTKEMFKEINQNKKRIRHLPESKDEIIQYAKRNDIHIDIEFFWKYFTDSHWIDSNGKEVWNWKQKLLTWEKKNKEKTNKTARELLDEQYNS